MSIWQEAVAHPSERGGGLARLFGEGVVSRSRERFLQPPISAVRGERDVMRSGVVSFFHLSGRTRRGMVRDSRGGEVPSSSPFRR